MIPPDQDQTNRITYEQAGVNYGVMDPGKIEAQGRAMRTAKNLERFGFKLVEESIGEPATVIDMGDFHLAFTMEGLGTKNLIIDDTDSGFDDEQLYYNIGKSSVAVGANDNICVGAQTFLIGPHWGTGFAFYVPSAQATLVQEIAKKRNFMTWDAGIVEEGPKQVIIEPKGITFSEDTLQIR